MGLEEPEENPELALLEYLQVGFHLSGNASSSFQELTVAKCCSWCFPFSKETFLFSHRRALTGAVHPWQHQQGQTTQNPRIPGWLRWEGTSGDQPGPKAESPGAGDTGSLDFSLFGMSPERERSLVRDAVLPHCLPQSLIPFKGWCV